MKYSFTKLLITSGIGLLLNTNPVWAVKFQDALNFNTEKQWEETTTDNISNLAPIQQDILRWQRLVAGTGDWTDYLVFLARYPNWPEIKTIKTHAERSFPDNIDPNIIVNFFQNNEPKTGSGITKLTKAERTLNQLENSTNSAKDAWENYPLSDTEQTWLLEHYRSDLEPLTHTRIWMLLDRNFATQAEPLLDALAPEDRALTEARIALQRNQKDVNDKIALVPADKLHDAGFAFDRFKWRQRKGHIKSPADLLIAQSTSAKMLGAPEKWANARRSLARQAMRKGNFDRAYKLASQHFLTSGHHYADLEWLSGYILLQKLKQPNKALIHFKQFLAAVGTPISLGRAHYWLGRNYEEIGDSENAKRAYLDAAKYQTSFYGQLAAEKAEVIGDENLLNKNQIEWKNAHFLADSRIKAGRTLIAANAHGLARVFMVSKGRELNNLEREKLASMAIELGSPHVALRIAKLSALENIVYPGPYFPIDATPKNAGPAPSEVNLAITRRESEFNPGAISRSGALGLMQLMPATAKEVSEQLELPFSASAVLKLPEYNTALGSKYLADMFNRFDGSFLLSFAAYNAGPNRVQQWIELFGDPRDPSIDPIDWIEGIPYRETRNYVMRITEALMIYRAKLSEGLPQLTLTKDLNVGSVPSPKADP